MTPLDLAHAAMEAADDDAARLRFYDHLADAEMILLLDAEPAGQAITPRVFPLEDGPVVLIFDTEDRLASFVGAPAPYAALPGRVIAAQLAGQGVGIGLNLGVAPSSMLLPPAAVDWLAETLRNTPTTAEARAESFHAPKGLPDALMQALAAKLGRAVGLAEYMLLAGVRYKGGRAGHMLAFVGARPGAEDALARAAGEALTFSGVEAGEMDVAFLAPADAALGRMAAVAHRFDLPQPETRPETQSVAPGSDPNRPPILR